jgi:membrane protease YdiL (CAAX protease family)
MALYHDVTAAEPAGQPLLPGIEQAAFAFIDLARLGRTDWWSATKGLLKFFGWQLAIGLALAVPIIFWRNALSKNVIDVAALAGAAAACWLAARGAAVRSQRRPLLSLVSAELRLMPSRVLIGAGLWLGASALLTALGLLYDAMVDPVGLADEFNDFAWPTSPEVILSGLLCVALFPVQAAGEELIFRGWLTQTLGQFLRWRWLLVLIVGLLFALAHGFSHGIFAVPYFVVMSLGLSALTLMDGRLELAIGAHAANNISFLLARLFSASAPPQLLFDDSQLPASAIIVGIIQSVLVVVAARWIVQRGERRRLAMAPDR